MITTVLFDMDGTLLPMDYDGFTRAYFGLLAKKAAPYGYEPKSLMDAVWAGTGAMVKNDGSEKNEPVFWRAFCGIFGEKAMRDKVIFDEFYREDFPKLREVCGYNPDAAALVRDLNAAGIQTVLATNPIFPAEAIECRIRWTGLQPEEFALVTTYENSCHCKPNPDYYRDILQQLSLRPEQCVMVGNDAVEDVAAGKAGIEVFLLTDCLLHQEQADISALPQGGYPELRRWLQGKGISIG